MLFNRPYRNENYRLLKELLPSDSPFTRVTPDGPFAYPYYHKNGIALRKALAKEKGIEGAASLTKDELLAVLKDVI